MVERDVLSDVKKQEATNFVFDDDTQQSPVLKVSGHPVGIRRGMPRVGSESLVAPGTLSTH